MACTPHVFFILPGSLLKGLMKKRIFLILWRFYTWWWIIQFMSADVICFDFFSSCRQEQRGAGCDWLRPPRVPGSQPLPSLHIRPLRDGRALQPAVHPAERLHQAPRHLPLPQVAPLWHRAPIRHHPAGPVPGTDPADAAGRIHWRNDTSGDLRFVWLQLGGCFVLRGAAARELQGPSETGRVGFCLPDHQWRCGRPRTWILWFSHCLVTLVCCLP